MTEGFATQIVDSIAAIDAATWNGLVAATDPHGNPFLDHAFFLALEESGCATRRTGWSPRHMVLRDGDEVVGVMPI